MLSSDPVATMLTDAAAEVGSLHRALLSGLRDLQSPQASVRAGGEQVVAKLMAASVVHFWLLLQGLEQAVARDAEALAVQHQLEPQEREPLEDASR